MDLSPFIRPFIRHPRDSSDFLDFTVTDPTTGVVTTISAHDSVQDQFTDDDGDNLGEQTSGGSASPATDTGHTNTSDNFQSKSDSKITVNGNSSPGTTVDYENDLTITDSGDDHNNDSFSVDATGTGSGSGTFDRSDQITLTGGGHSNVTESLSGDDGHGDSASISSSDNQTTIQSGTFSDSDSGSESMSDTNDQLTSDSRSTIRIVSGIRVGQRHRSQYRHKRRHGPCNGLRHNRGWGHLFFSE